VARNRSARGQSARRSRGRSASRRAGRHPPSVQARARPSSRRERRSAPAGDEGRGEDLFDASRPPPTVIERRGAIRSPARPTPPASPRRAVDRRTMRRAGAHLGRSNDGVTPEMLDVEAVLTLREDTARRSEFLVAGADEGLARSPRMAVKAPLAESFAPRAAWEGSRYERHRPEETSSIRLSPSTGRRLLSVSFWNQGRNSSGVRQATNVPWMSRDRHCEDGHGEGASTVSPTAPTGDGDVERSWTVRRAEPAAPLVAEGIGVSAEPSLYSLRRSHR